MIDIERGNIGNEPGPEPEPIPPTEVKDLREKFDGEFNTICNTLSKGQSIITFGSKMYDKKSLQDGIQEIRSKGREKRGALRVISQDMATRNKDLESGLTQLLEQENSENFSYWVEVGIQQAEDSLKERFENPQKEKDMLPFHNVGHTKGVIRRVETILKAIQNADPQTVSDEEVKFGRLVAAYHDTVQKWDPVEMEEKEGEFKGFKKLIRKRRIKDNEVESANELTHFMIEEVNRKQGKSVFTKNEGFVALEAIKATVPGWDPENKTVSQPNLESRKEASVSDKEIKISMVEIALALSDLGVAGMDGPEKFTNEGIALFREENLDVLAAITSKGVDGIKAKDQKYFKTRMVGWLKSQAGFAKGRQTRLDKELELIPEAARQAVKSLFDKFEDSIQVSGEVAAECEKMTFGELVKYMGY